MATWPLGGWLVLFLWVGGLVSDVLLYRISSSDTDRHRTPGDSTKVSVGNPPGHNRGLVRFVGRGLTVVLVFEVES